MLYYILSLPILIIAIWMIIGHIRKLHRRALLKKNFPADWLHILKQNVPLYQRMPAILQQELLGHIHVFLEEKEFVGCETLEITDEIRITIAAQACILLLNKKTTYYPHLKTILVYPSAYLARKDSHADELITSNNEIRFGESWHHGPVVLAWDHTKQSAFDIENGHNLVLHEFAHQLDQEDELSDGAPLLNSRTQYISWARVLSREYAELQQKIDHGEKTLLDPYGAVSPAEFFAILTEAFFEKSQQLKKHKPELYETLRNFYAVDPAIWPNENN